MTLERFSETLLKKIAQDKINRSHQRIDDMERLFNRIFNIQLKLKNTRVEHLKEKLEAFNPLKIMQRGFTLVTDNKRNLISGIDQLETGKEINIIFKNGEAGCEVKSSKQQDSQKN